MGRYVEKDLHIVDLLRIMNNYPWPNINKRDVKNFILKLCASISLN